MSTHMGGVNMCLLTCAIKMSNSAAFAWRGAVARTRMHVALTATCRGSHVVGQHHPRKRGQRQSSVGPESGEKAPQRPPRLGMPSRTGTGVLREESSRHGNCQRAFDHGGLPESSHRAQRSPDVPVRDVLRVCVSAPFWLWARVARRQAHRCAGFSVCGAPACGLRGCGWRGHAPMKSVANRLFLIAVSVEHHVPGVCSFAFAACGDPVCVRSCAADVHVVSTPLQRLWAGV